MTSLCVCVLRVAQPEAAASMQYSLTLGVNVRRGSGTNPHFTWASRLDIAQRNAVCESGCLNMR